MAARDPADPAGVPEITVCAHLRPTDVQRLCEDVRPLLSGGRRRLLCSVSEAPDLGVVDALARLLLISRQVGGVICVRSTPELQRMFTLAGLDDVLAELREPLRQPEAGEEGRVQEVVDVRDPSP